MQANVNENVLSGLTCLNLNTAVGTCTKVCLKHVHFARSYRVHVKSIQELWESHACAEKRSNTRQNVFQTIESLEGNRFSMKQVGRNPEGRVICILL